MLLYYKKLSNATLFQKNGNMFIFDDDTNGTFCRLKQSAFFAEKVALGINAQSLRIDQKNSRCPRTAGIF